MLQTRFVSGTAYERRWQQAAVEEVCFAERMRECHGHATGVDPFVMPSTAAERAQNGHHGEHHIRI